MIKKTIKYKDYFDEEREEDFYFNLTKAEIIEMEMTQEGGLEYYLKKIIAEKDKNKLFQYFKTIILSAYGEKSADGRQFIKSEELSRKFCQNPAYDVLIMELLGDASYAATFIRQLMPADLAEKVKEMEAANGGNVIPMA